MFDLYIRLGLLRWARGGDYWLHSIANLRKFLICIAVSHVSKHVNRIQNEKARQILPPHHFYPVAGKQNFKTALKFVVSMVKHKKDLHAGKNLLAYRPVLAHSQRFYLATDKLGQFRHIGNVLKGFLPGSKRMVDLLLMRADCSLYLLKAN